MRMAQTQISTEILYPDLSEYCSVLAFTCSDTGETLCFVSYFGQTRVSLPEPPQWGAADAEIKVPSGENTELKRSPFKAWSRSVYSQACYAYCQRFLPR